MRRGVCDVLVIIAYHNLRWPTLRHRPLLETFPALAQAILVDFRLAQKVMSSAPILPYGVPPWLIFSLANGVSYDLLPWATASPFCRRGSLRARLEAMCAGCS